MRVCRKYPKRVSRQIQWCSCAKRELCIYRDRFGTKIPLSLSLFCAHVVHIEIRILLPFNDVTNLLVHSLCSSRVFHDIHGVFVRKIYKLEFCIFFLISCIAPIMNLSRFNSSVMWVSALTSFWLKLFMEVSREEYLCAPNVYT